jgi:hypothetical protein
MGTETSFHFLKNRYLILHIVVVSSNVIKYHPKKDKVFSKRQENRIKGTSEELPLSPLIQLLLSCRLTVVTSTSLVGAGRGGGG